jgi:hypothetical protein
MSLELHTRIAGRPSPNLTDDHIFERLLALNLGRAFVQG